MPVLPPYGGAPAHILEHSYGVLIAAYSYREKPYGIKIMFSHNKGASWNESEFIYSNEISYDMGYPTTVELKDGSLITVFYATRTRV